MIPANFEVMPEDRNYVTQESVGDMTMGELIDLVSSGVGKAPFGIAHSINGGRVTIGEYEPCFNLPPIQHHEDGRMTIACSILMHDARKFYQGPYDVALLHDKLREAGSERGYGVDTDDDAPAFYTTYVYFDMLVGSSEGLVSRFLERLKEKSDAVIREAKIAAVQKQIDELVEFQKSL